MNKLLLAFPLVAVLAGCQTGTFELETPTDDISVDLWMGTTNMNDIISINGGEYHKVKLVVNKVNPSDWIYDQTGKSGFHLNDNDGNLLVNFKCTRTKLNQFIADQEDCVRFEVDKSVVAEIPVGTEYRK